MINLRSLVEKLPDADILRDMISFATEQLMEIEIGALTGAGHGEKGAARLGAAPLVPRASLRDAGRHCRAAFRAAAQG